SWCDRPSFSLQSIRAGHLRPSSGLCSPVNDHEVMRPSGLAPTPDMTLPPWFQNRDGGDLSAALTNAQIAQSCGGSRPPWGQNAFVRPLWQRFALRLEGALLRHDRRLGFGRGGHRVCDRDGRWRPAAAERLVELDHGLQAGEPDLGELILRRE